MAVGMSLGGRIDRTRDRLARRGHGIRGVNLVSKEDVTNRCSLAETLLPFRRVA